MKIDRIPLLAAAARLRAGDECAPVAARVRIAPDGYHLVDASGELALAEAVTGVQDGDIVSGTLLAGDDGFLLQNTRVRAARTRPPTAQDERLAQRWPLLARRAAMVTATRKFFSSRGFLELDTPARVMCPGLEPHLHALRAGDAHWLATSPELHLKRALAAGAERVFEIARAFRGSESGSWHLTEFTMLEWYRAYEGLDALVDDIEGLVSRVAGAGKVNLRDVSGCDVSQPAERITVREAFARYANIDLAALRERDALAQAAQTLDCHVHDADDWDDLFFKVFLRHVEPELGRERMTVISEYPASQAALARVRDDPEWPVALRFELYVAGVELANAFDELTDPVEQRRRHQADRETRTRLGREVPPLDESFLRALEAGHPPAAGIALGLDRLIAVLLGCRDLDGVVPFPDDVR